MPRRKVNYRATRPRKIQYKSQEKLVDDFLTYQIDRPGFAGEVEGFSEYFLAALASASINLARVGVGVAKRALIAAETPWGQARMRGEYYGVRFRPYGKGPGRFASGNMFNALKIIDSNAGTYVGSKKRDLRVEWGYDTKMDRGRSGGPYFRDQEVGFLNPLSFDPDQTRIDGVARFGRARRARWVKGARALEAGMERIGDRAEAYYSKAWEIARKKFESDGFAASGVGTFIDANKAYRKPPSSGTRNWDPYGNMGISLERLSEMIATSGRFKI